MFDWFWEFLYGLIKVPLFCIDFILRLANMICGIESIKVNGEETELTYYFLSSSEIMDAFKYVCIIGFVLLILFTVYRLIRGQTEHFAGKTPQKICLDTAKTVLYFLLVPGLMLLATVAVTTFMRAIYDATSFGDSSLGSSMFTIFAEEAYNGSLDKETALNMFRSGELDYYDTATVASYFKLSKINFFLGFLGSIAVFLMLGLALLSFVERVISIVILFVISPVSISSSVLDEGARFKLWRDQVINKFLIAYGGIIALNIFMLLMSVTNRIDFFDNSFLNGLTKLAFVLGGALACRRGMELVGNLISQGAGSQEMRDQAHALGGMAAAAHMAGKVVGGVAKGVKGYFNAGKTLFEQATGKPIMSAIVDKINGNVDQANARQAQEEKENRFIEKLNRGGMSSGGANQIQNTLSGGAQNAPTTPPGNGASNAGGQQNNGGQKQDDKVNNQASDTIKQSLQNQQQAKQQPQQQQESDKHQ